VSKKKQFTVKPIGERIATARREGRTQKALELAHALAKYEPTDANRELVRQVTLERGHGLRLEGTTQEAITLFMNALTLDGPTEYLAKAALGLAMCGAFSQALVAIETLPDANVRQQVLQIIVDSAVLYASRSASDGATSPRAYLPESLHAAFDLIVQAFAHYEAGRDDEARAALQGIGLQSPLLEWKVLLRGLIAYQANDDARALENWQRLSDKRLPSRLCAPLRASIDPAFLKAQSETVQQSLRTRLMQQQGLTAAPLLRELRDLLNKENLAPAFRKTEALLPNLRQSHPGLIARLANVFFWTIVSHGQPEDLERFQRVFGSPADDPRLHRLEALALEARGLWPEAHKAWEHFIQYVAGDANHWPTDISAHVRAIIWTRMAENASPERKRKGQTGNPLFDFFADKTGPLKPDAEQCLLNAIKLMPDARGCYRALFELYRQDNKSAKAKKIGEELLKRFPDHAETLEALGELAMDTRDYKKAQDYFEKALTANPLNRTLRFDLAHARQLWGVELTIDKNYARAREQYQQALNVWDGSKTTLLCQWAVCEMKAKDPARAQELIAQALAEPDHRLACRYALVGESVRAKLPAKEKKQIAADLKEALARAPTPAEILVLVGSAAQQRLTHEATFHGQKTQEKTILKFLDDIHADEFNEKQLERLVGSLMALNARKPWFACLNHARRRFLKNAHFRLSFADYYITDPGREPKTYLAREHLDAARRLVEEMPRGEEQQQLMDEIKAKDEITTQMEARRGAMMDAIDRIFGGYDPDENDDDDFDEDDYF
jgi:tetratricopeptide (TPR) repeat protein